MGPVHLGEGRGHVRVGCSGWMYRDWRVRFYPERLPQRRWLEHYATVFDSVELNSTFYRLPTAETVDRWAASAPEGFTFAIKLGAFGSHRMKLRDPHGWLGHHVERFTRLGTHLGPTLVQLPPRWRRDAGRLGEFLAAAPTSFRWAVELRDPSWLHDDVFDVLARHGAALCLHDLLPDHPRVLTASWTYLRFHGPTALATPYCGRYGTRRLRPVAAVVAEWVERGVDAYAYFNNDVEAAAVADARRFRSLLDAARS